MSVDEAQLRFENARLTAQVTQLQQALSNSTSEVNGLRSSMMPGSESEQLQALKAELDHERQKAKAIWAAVRHIAGEDTARRIEEEVSRRPIVAAPKAKRRGTMPHVPAPHMTVVAKTATAPKWPPTTQQEEVKVLNASQTEPALAEAVKVVAAPSGEEQAEGRKPEFDVDIGSVPPSVVRQLFGGTKGKDQKETATATVSTISLPIKLDSTVESHSARVAEVPSPMRRRESSTTLSSVPLLPRPHTSHPQPDQMHQKVRADSWAPTTAVQTALKPQRVSAASPAPPQVRLASSTEGNATPMGSTVRDRIRQLELSARRSSVMM